MKDRKPSNEIIRKEKQEPVKRRKTVEIFRKVFGFWK